jgi:TRAP-type C4-dicarboxylate transport system substrate-binding protein
MHRSLVSFVLLALLTLPIISSAATFKIATIAPEGSAWMQQMRAGAIAIKERTLGRVQIKFYSGGVMGNEKSVLRKIHMGQLQGGAFTGGGLGRITSDAALYGLPLLARSEQEMHYVRQTMDAVVNDALEQSGFVSFGFASGGFANLMSKTPITGIDDLKGQKVWVPEGDRASYAVMEALGLAPVTLPLSDVLTGLQAGLVEVIGTSPLGALAFQWYTRVAYITPIPLVYIYGALVLDKKKFNQICPQDQTVMREILSNMYRGFDQQNELDNDAALAALKKQGIQIVPPQAGEFERWNTVANTAIDKMIKDGLFNSALYVQLQQQLSNYRHQDNGKN